MDITDDIADRMVIILRGPPGSGKSTVGRMFYKNFGAVICTADDFWTSPIDESNDVEDGYVLSENEYGVPVKYKFDVTRIREAHSYCMSVFLEEISKDSPMIVVSNTFTEVWEFINYLNAAVSHGYTVRVISFVPQYVQDIKDLVKRNIHKVSESVVIKMCFDFEPFSSEWRISTSWTKEFFRIGEDVTSQFIIGKRSNLFKKRSASWN
jgi:hypothetical protein